MQCCWSVKTADSSELVLTLSAMSRANEPFGKCRRLTTFPASCPLRRNNATRLAQFPTSNIGKITRLRYASLVLILRGGLLMQ